MAGGVNNYAKSMRSRAACTFLFFLIPLLPVASCGYVLPVSFHENEPVTALNRIGAPNSRFPIILTLAAARILQDLRIRRSNLVKMNAEN